MGFCILGGKEGYLRKSLSDKLTSLGQTVGIGAAVADFTNAIQNIYTSRYTEGQDSLKVARKLTLTSSQTGTNVNITDNWYTTCDASAVYTAGQNSLKVDRKLTLTSSQTGSNVNITDNWYTTCDASAVYGAGQSSAKLIWSHAGRGDNIQDDTGDNTPPKYRDSAQVTATKNQTVTVYWTRRGWYQTDINKVVLYVAGTAKNVSVSTADGDGYHVGSTNISVTSGQTVKIRCYGQDGTGGSDNHSAACCVVF